MTQQQPLQYQKGEQSKLFPELCRDPWIQRKGSWDGGQPRDEGRDGSLGCQELRGWMLEASPGHLRLRVLVGWGGKVGFLFRKRAGNRAKPFRWDSVTAHAVAGGPPSGCREGHAGPLHRQSVALDCALIRGITSRGLWTALLSVVLHLGVYDQLR